MKWRPAASLFAVVTLGVALSACALQSSLNRTNTALQTRRTEVDSMLREIREKWLELHASVYCHMVVVHHRAPIVNLTNPYPECPPEPPEGTPPPPPPRNWP